MLFVVCLKVPYQANAVKGVVKNAFLEKLKLKTLCKGQGHQSTWRTNNWFVTIRTVFRD